ncbi:U2 small nuclear ribonucleoprotein a', partial [Globisporangium splendens]
MRLTADVILRAQVSINPLRERELSLRGLKAPAIENLGVTKDGFDCIDLSDNEIKKLENFPRLKRLRMLLLHNNHISKFQDNLADSIANLEYLILTGNKIAQLAEIDRLVGFTKLDTLVLGGNPVTKCKYYREYVIHKLPQLKVLDFKKIKPHDREAAKVLFNSLAGQKIEQEAHQEAGSESSVATSTQDMQKVSIAPPPPQTHAVAAAPPPPPAPVRQESPKKAQAVSSGPVKISSSAEPVTTSVKQQAAEEAAPNTPPSTKPQDDVDMENADDDDVDRPAAASVPFTPSKPIEQMTVTALREELKQRGLSIKGLKAELVKRLKDATGA